MKAIKLFALLLLLASCTNDAFNDCKEEKQDVIEYYDGLINEIKNREYWSSELIRRLEKDKESALNRVKCN